MSTKFSTKVVFAVFAIACIMILAGVISATASVAYTRTYGNNVTVSHYGGCKPYTHSMVLHSSNGYSHTPVMNHSACEVVSVEKSNDKKTVASTPIAPVAPSTPVAPITPVVSTPAPSTPATPATPAPATPAPSTPDVKPTKVHCNNGEGNGGEGCSPANSDNANNDENNTTPREDKSKSGAPLASGFIGVFGMTFKIGRSKKLYTLHNLYSVDFPRGTVKYTTLFFEVRQSNGMKVFHSHKKITVMHILPQKEVVSYADNSEALKAL